MGEPIGKSYRVGDEVELARESDPARARTVDYIGRARGCIGPYPCGQGAGAHGQDLPCDCAWIAGEIDRRTRLLRGALLAIGSGHPDPQAVAQRALRDEASDRG